MTLLDMMKFGETKASKMNNTKEFNGTSDKTPAQVLHEQYGNIQYHFKDIGDGNPPSFLAVAQVEGLMFEGTGPSKAFAKHNLAEQALQRLQGFSVPSEAQDVLNLSQKTLQKPVYNFQKGEIQIKQNNSSIGSFSLLPGYKQQFKNLPSIDKEKARSCPSMVLSEVFPDVKLHWLDGIGRGDQQFKVEAEILDRKFLGEGRSKKLAKLNLAKAILLCLYNVQDFNENEASSQVPPNQKVEKSNVKKYPMTELKELVGEHDLTVQVIPLDRKNIDEEKMWHATIVVKGRAYEAMAKNKHGAKLRAAKKALEVLKPKKDPPESSYLNLNGIDISCHPAMLFNSHFPNVNFIETECKTESGTREFHLQAVIDGHEFKSTASSKKKAKLRLVLEVFETLENTAPTEWMTLDLDKIYDEPSC